jgi:nicotinate-nucleotide adenylyltransferase
MLRLAVGGHEAFIVSDLETRLPVPNYTVQTLRHLREQFPEAEWFLLLGADSLCEFPTWYEPFAIAQMATLVVAARPGYTRPESLPPEFRVRWVQSPLIEISSTDIRQRIRQGRSIRYLVPRAVECYIAQQRLYLPTTP